MRTVTGPWRSFRAWDGDIVSHTISTGQFWDQQKRGRARGTATTGPTTSASSPITTTRSPVSERICGTMSLALSKTLDPADFGELHLELEIVDRHFYAEREQHPMRRWEYAMALRAFRVYQEEADDPHANQLVDVGGAGSSFWRMLAAEGHHRVQVIDPEENCRLDQYLRQNAPLADAVFCLSVLEHVEDLDRFCYHLSCLVAPGGLLFLTMDYCDNTVFGWPEDRYHFHWMRKRIFNWGRLGGLAGSFLDRDFTVFGERDSRWHGPQVYDYSFASLALVKRS